MHLAPTSFVRRTAVIALLIVASGCAAVHQFSDSTERENAAANFRARWIGRSEADVVRRYGAPAETVPAPSGHRLLTYRAPGATGAGAAQATGDARPCNLQFEIDDATSIVVRAVVTGADCRGDL